MSQRIPVPCQEHQTSRWVYGCYACNPETPRSPSPTPATPRWSVVQNPSDEIWFGDDYYTVDSIDQNYIVGEKAEAEKLARILNSHDALVAAVQAAKMSLINDVDYARHKPLIATLDAAITLAYTGQP